MNAKVRSVEHVSLQFGFSEPPTLIIQAKGTVPTGGWTNGALVPYVYIAPPADGIWDFDFVAQHPIGMSIQVISQITSKPFIARMPSWFKGVRIHSSTNNVESAGGDVNANAQIKIVNFEVFETGDSDDEGPNLRGHDTFPWKVSEKGHDFWPWARNGGVDGFPWCENPNAEHVTANPVNEILEEKD